MDGDVEAIAAGLSEAQRAALVNAPSTPLGNCWLVCHGATKSALVRARLATGSGDWCVLTDAGLRVKQALETPPVSEEYTQALRDMEDE